MCYNNNKRMMSSGLARGAGRLKSSKSAISSFNAVESCVSVLLYVSSAVNRFLRLVFKLRVIPSGPFRYYGLETIGQVFKTYLISCDIQKKGLNNLFQHPKQMLWDTVK